MYDTAAALNNENRFSNRPENRQTKALAQTNYR